jgi:hypothetical protein
VTNNDNNKDLKLNKTKGRKMRRKRYQNTRCDSRWDVPRSRARKSPVSLPDGQPKTKVGIIG